MASVKYGATTPKVEMPTDLAEAHVWIRRLQDAYRIETDYRKRLEQEVTQQRRVVEIAQFWHHARGMHRKPWLARLRDAIVAFEDPDKQAQP